MLKSRRVKRERAESAMKDEETRYLMQFGTYRFYMLKR